MLKDITLLLQVAMDEELLPNAKKFSMMIVKLVYRANPEKFKYRWGTLMTTHCLEDFTEIKGDAEHTTFSPLVM